mmetsp:Transcript_9413/g.16215  ORF Transcript_9413/g.16215 Transcript_9413/m.16215 type:complete len:246 (-) Transcript_9413:206-943(-)
MWPATDSLRLRRSWAVPWTGSIARLRAGPATSRTKLPSWRFGTRRRQNRSSWCESYRLSRAAIRPTCGSSWCTRPSLTRKYAASAWHTPWSDLASASPPHPTRLAAYGPPLVRAGGPRWRLSLRTARSYTPSIISLGSRGPATRAWSPSSPTPRCSTTASPTTPGLPSPPPPSTPRVVLFTLPASPWTCPATGCSCSTPGTTGCSCSTSRPAASSTTLAPPPLASTTGPSMRRASCARRACRSRG